MKFSCEKALLQSAVATASRTVSQKSAIPALEGILIEAGSSLRLTGYNLETGIRTTLPADVTQPGSLVLSARLFGEIVRKMPDDVLYFTADNYTVNVFGFLKTKRVNLYIVFHTEGCSRKVKRLKLLIKYFFISTKDWKSI